jgi:hypothetical protein
MLSPEAPHFVVEVPASNVSAPIGVRRFRFGADWIPTRTFAGETVTDIQFDNQGLWQAAGDDTSVLESDAQARQSLETRIEQGRLLRSVVPREVHASWAPAPSRRSPVDILSEDDSDRQPDLVPLRYGRMSASPFTFYRGAAAIMSADLETTPTTGLLVQLCGDAHLSNFGVFASPERRLVSI